MFLLHVSFLSIFVYWISKLTIFYIYNQYFFLLWKANGVSFVFFYFQRNANVPKTNIRIFSFHSLHVEQRERKKRNKIKEQKPCGHKIKFSGKFPFQFFRSDITYCLKSQFYRFSLNIIIITIVRINAKYNFNIILIIIFHQEKKKKTKRKIKQKKRKWLLLLFLLLLFASICSFYVSFFSVLSFRTVDFIIFSSKYFFFVCSNWILRLSFRFIFSFSLFLFVFCFFQ